MTDKTEVAELIEAGWKLHDAFRTGDPDRQLRDGHDLIVLDGLLNTIEQLQRELEESAGVLNHAASCSNFDEKKIIELQARVDELESERDDLDERLNERYSRCNSLEADNKRLLDELKSLQEGWDLIKQLNEIVQKENTRYREALEIMADRNRFWREVEFQTGSDRRQYAQQVLVELDKAEALKDE